MFKISKTLYTLFSSKLDFNIASNKGPFEGKQSISFLVW